MVAPLYACCLSSQIYLVFVHSQNADMPEQTFIEEKVEKPPCMCSLRRAAFSKEVFHHGHPASQTLRSKLVCPGKRVGKWCYIQPGKHQLMSLSSQHGTAPPYTHPAASHTHRPPCQAPCLGPEGSAATPPHCSPLMEVFSLFAP